MGTFEDGSEWEELGFVPERMAEVAGAFGRFGAQVESVTDPSEEEIETLLRSWLVTKRPSANVLVIHLIGHGVKDRSGRLSFIGRDTHEVDVDRWIGRAQREADRQGDGKRVVFLVDTCDAGTATGRQSLTDLGDERAVWSLGATVSGSPTERGRFSGWVATALHRLADTDFALESRTLDFSQFVGQVTAVVKADSDWRISFGFSVEQGDGDWPFLPNPKAVELSQQEIERRRESFWYVPGQDFGTQVATGAEISDAVYFTDRASGRGLVSASPTTGFFSGQAGPLAEYRRWLEGDSPLLIVTGAAGSGKSGLLGVLVCAAHPHLRLRFRALWEAADHDLPEIPDIISLHARQRTERQVIDMIVGQGGLTPPEPEEGRNAHDDNGALDTFRWTAYSLREALFAEEKRRLIVIDAVDESAEPNAVVRLIEVLTAPPEKDERPGQPCRVLAGSRRTAVPDVAAEVDTPSRVTWLDLDTADPAVVERDIRSYIKALLRSDRRYAPGTASSDYVDLLADTASRRIVRDGGPGGSWGPFLLAGMFVHYLVTLDNPPQDLVSASAHAFRAAGDLPTILEAVLTARQSSLPLLRPVLAALARSKGDGMPLTVLRRCVAVFRETPDGPETDFAEEDFVRTLREASPYLRTGRDPVGDVALYRLFHQGLTDHLRDHPHAGLEPVDAPQALVLEKELLAAITGPYAPNPAQPDSWETAEPYVLRHALEHVVEAESPDHAERLLTDPHFLVRFDTRRDLRAFDLTTSARASDYVSLLGTSWAAHGLFTNAADRASVLAYDALRLNLDGMHDEFSAIARSLSAHQRGTGHPVLWAEGGHLDTSARLVMSEGLMVHDLVFSPDGKLLAAATHEGVQVRETKTWQLTVRPFGAPEGWVSAVAFSPDGRRLAFNTGADGRQLQLWDVENQCLIGSPWPYHSNHVVSLAFSADGSLLAAGSEDHSVSVWDVTSGPPGIVARLQHDHPISVVAFSPDSLRLAACGRDGVTLWNSTDQWQQPKRLTTNWTAAVAFSPDGALLVALDSDGILTVRSAASGEIIRFAQLDEEDITGALAFSPDGALLAVGYARTVYLLDVASTEIVGHLRGHTDDISGCAFHPMSPFLLLTGDGDGDIRLWNRVVDTSAAAPLVQFPADMVRCSSDGRLLVAAENEGRTLRLYNPATGEVLSEISLGRHAATRLLEISPDGDLIVLLGTDQNLLFARIGFPSRSTIVEIPSAEAIPGTRPVACFSPDGGLLAVLLATDADQFRGGPTLIRVWDTQSLRPTGRIPLPTRPDRFHFAGPDKLFVSTRGAIAVYDCSRSGEGAP
ncbi:PD40 domain-containing protein [Streptomyces liangshanensis]|uniref:Nephrocystin 3-like N-terminal domain-containing protein n=1 Tax=Streptomyces liangshanensis TaxID=2717324 RepID=A0A6G9GT15_9ACTN|nr:PD40 domain-containing protein [Streptomyces liangshanensis]QIQ01388.1 hypothetical protein HA039_02925 [Streptomyces liangshanensis]